MERPEKVYNFQVEGFHTYHVESSRVMVHIADAAYGAEGDTGTKVTSNLGNDIDITPSENHKTDSKKFRIERSS